MRYLKKRIDTKMDKELSSKQPPFDELVADVVRLSPPEPEPARARPYLDLYCGFLCSP